jgi:adenylyltransferase/sulfurtransferase
VQHSERETIWITDAHLSALGPTSKIIFLLEPGEMAPSTGRSNFHAIPAHDLAALREFVATGPVALSCRHGLRSAALARLLRAEGGQEIYALKAAPDQS